MDSKHALMVALIGGLLLFSGFVALVNASEAFAATDVLRREVVTNKYVEYHVETPYKEYLASWRNDGRGDNVVFTAWGLRPANGNLPSGYYYEITLNGQRMNGEGGRPNYEANCPRSDAVARPPQVVLDIWTRVDLEPCTFKLTGSDTGKLRVHLYVEHCPLGRCTRYGVSFDEALVEDGTTTLEFANAQRTYEEGETVKLRVRTGSCGVKATEPGYTGCYALNIYDTTGKPVCANQRPERLYCDQTFVVPAHAGDSRWGPTTWHTVQFTIPKGAFVPRSPSDNKWTVELLNNIVSSKTSTFFAIDSHDKAPKAPRITLGPDPLIEGTRAIVTIDAESNPNGSLDLRRARVFAWYGVSTHHPGFGSDDWVEGFQDGKNVTLTLDPASPTGKRLYHGTVDFPVHKRGQVQVEVFVVDTDGRASEPAKASEITVGGAPAKEEIPTDTSYQRLMVGVLLGAVAAGVAVFVFVRNPIFRWGGVVAVAFGTLLVVGFIYFTATIEVAA